MARPEYKRDEDAAKLIETLAGYGLNQQMIASVVVNPQTGKPISKDTLTKYYADELESGKAKAATKVTRVAFQLASSGRHPAMTMFWLKTQLRWTETHRVENLPPGAEQLRFIKGSMNEQEAADAYQGTLHHTK